MVKIASVSTTHPPHRVEPEELRAYIRRSLPPASAGRFCRILDASQARGRHTIAPIAELLQLQTIEDRTQRFVEHSLAMGETVAQLALTGAGIEPAEITTLVSVSSTGYMAPSLDAHLVARLGLRSTVRRVPITQLGCSGGVSAIAIAADLIRSVSGSALVVSVEICSLCLQSAAPSPTDLIASILFGDGAAATVLRTDDAPLGGEILGTQSVLLNASLDRVGIRPSATGLRLVLSREMPSIVRRHLPGLLTGFLEPYGLHPDDLAFWLVHPGGPRVLEAVEQSFDIPRAALAHSWEVWREYGNMSSATALFVLDRWLTSRPAGEPERVGILLAFGPGVSCEMVLLRSGNASADSTC
jgi:alkylresorcinol/alkylpyrone synthase